MAGKRKPQHPGRAPRTGKPLDEASQKSDTSASAVRLEIFQAKTGDAPFLRFLADRKDREKADIRAALGLLAERGHLLRPPLNEHLGDQLYYLRVSTGDGAYRIFYWPHGRGILILGHGFSKKTNRCPPTEIKRALKHRELYRADPGAHTYKGRINETGQAEDDH